MPAGILTGAVDAVAQAGTDFAMAGRRAARAMGTAGALWLAAGMPALAGDTAREALVARYPELHRAIYDAAVCEYCGLITPEVASGFHLLAADLIERDGLLSQEVREIRISAWTKADLEWSNRGVGGFRNWCRTDGASAAQRFVDYGAGATTKQAPE